MKKIATSLLLVFAMVQFVAAQSVSLSNYDYLSPTNNGLAIWLKPSWKSGMQKYVFDNNSGQLSQFSDGTALLTGTLVNKNDATEKWYIEIALKGKKDWATFSGAGNNYCDPSKLTAGQHTSWDYYEMDYDEDNVMEDVSGKFDYVTLEITGSSSCGFQVGYGANGASAVNGVGGMFSFSGSDDAGVVSYSGNGGMCLAICCSGVVTDHFQAWRFDHKDVKPYTHAVYLNDDNKGVLRYIFGPKGGTFTTYADGTAHLYGEVYLISNNDDGVTWKEYKNDKFEINMYFNSKKDWANWSANGNGYYDTYNVADSQFVNWDYYLVDATKPNTLTGRGTNGGTVLFLDHAPSDLSIAVQFGKNSTAQNVTVFGMGGWFDYTVGKTKDGFTGGRGDVNFYLQRFCSEGEYLFGIKGGKSLTDKRIYLLEGADATIEAEDIPFRSNALAADPNSSYVYFMQTVAPFNLARYDLATGHSEIVGATGFSKGSTYRLDFNAAGVLYASRGKKLYTINTTTGKATCVGKMKGFSRGQKKGRGDIAFSPSGELYLLTKSDLFTVDLNNLRVCSKGAHGISLISGMDFDSEGNLYVSNIIKKKGTGIYSKLFEMDANNASSTLIGNTQVRINDLTFFDGCYTSPDERMPSCVSKVKSRKNSFAQGNGVVEYDQDFSDIESDDALIALDDLEDIKLYPTVIGKTSNNEITVYSGEELENIKLSVMDNAGRLVQEVEIPYLLSEAQVNLGDLHNGMYFINVEMAGQVQTHKIIVAK